MKTVAQEASDRFTIKKSEFIGIIVPVNSMSEATERVTATWAQFDGARHIAWAANVANRVRMSDDGEPSGTAGMPILNVLQHQAIDQVLLMVVRYYGGIKLGAGGLTRAYSQAASMAVQAATYIPYIATVMCRITTDYAKEAQVRHFAQQFDAALLDTSYGEAWTVTIEVLATHLEAFKVQLTNGLQGQLSFEVLTDS